jgi:hypothetical protein
VAPQIQPPPPADMTGFHIALGLGAAAVGGLVAWKLAKKYG